MGSIEKMLAFAKDKVGKVGYSMKFPQRLGDKFYDCSSFVYKALVAGGFLDERSRVGNTESLYRLKGVVLEEIFSYDDIQRGDIFICGREGYSQGSSGHTGIFLSKDKIIHCSYRNRGVGIDRAGDFLGRKRSDQERYFRPQSTEKVEKLEPTYRRALVKNTVNVRARPSTKAPILAVYYPNSLINYDKILRNEGYIWISYIGEQSKERRYVSIGDWYGNTWVEI